MGEKRNLKRVVKLISDRTEIEQKLLVALVELLHERLELEPSDRFASHGMAHPPLLTVNEFCKRARISRATLYRMMNTGSVSHYKLGGRILFDEHHMAEFLNRHRVEASSSPSKITESNLKP